jgi:cytochrome c-type biogenesis protein CcmH/NrfG
MLILLGFFVVVGVVVVALVIVALSLSRRKSAAASAGASTGPVPDPAAQIEKLARLRAEGLLSETEYEEKRQELLRRI